jgi:hypothetical protein
MGREAGGMDDVSRWDEMGWGPRLVLVLTLLGLGVVERVRGGVA